MKLKEILKRWLTNSKQKELQTQIQQLELQLSKVSNDNKFILKHMVSLANISKSLRNGQSILNDKGDDCLDICEGHNDALTAIKHNLEQDVKAFNGMHQRLQAVEGYYFDKPLKDPIVFN